MASFTAEVKDELSRVEGRCPTCERAQLSALLRVCGTLSFKGTGRYALRITTETGAVARTIIKLVHDIFDLNTSLTIRRSVLHKTRNYLIELAEQDGLEEALVELGILVPGQGLAAGIPRSLLQKRCCREAFVRGAFMAGGFIADPRGDFHLEMTVTGEQFASDIASMLRSYGVRARLNRRRGAFAVYIKSYDDIERVLGVLGAKRSAHTVMRVKGIKSAKNATNRLVNADLANASRAADASYAQQELILRVAREVGMDELPRSLREFCKARLENPGLSLADLGATFDPPLSKSAMYHRLLRLKALLDDKNGTGAQGKKDA
jgi:DNA-binding protein WhiA